MESKNGREKMKRRLLAGILCAVMAVSAFVPSAAEAADRREQDYKMGNMPSSGKIELHGEDEFVLRGSLPSSWNSVQKGYITPVKDQNPYGTCWAFASVNAVESSAIAYGTKVNGVKATKNNLDLSEYHLAYFFYHRKKDPLKLAAYDYNVPKAWNGDSNGNYLDRGGNNLLTPQDLLNWSGPVDEELAPYEDAEYNNTLPSSLAFNKDALHVHSAFYLDMTNLDKVKSYIMRYGSVAVSYYHDWECYSYENSSFYNPYYNSANHAVSIVGWDDNYSKDNFYPNTPGDDGAWIVKNSWGDYWGNNGYFYMSYEDAVLTQNIAVAYGVHEASKYRFNYHYDGGAYSGGYYAYGGAVTFANVFKATCRQTLVAVGFGTWERSQKVSIQVYRNPKAGNPRSGKKMFKKAQKTTIPAGFKTIKLNKAVNLSRGQKFSVVITYRNTDNSAMIDESMDWGWVQFITRQKSGQSYVIDSSGDIRDLASEGQTARIKAYTVKR